MVKVSEAAGPWTLLQTAFLVPMARHVEAFMEWMLELGVQLVTLILVRHHVRGTGSRLSV